MDRSNHSQSSEHLLDAIGNIRDSFIFEAENYKPVERFAKLRRLAVIAVASTLILTLLISVLVGTLIRPDQNGSADESNGSSQNGAIAPENEDLKNPEDTAGEYNEPIPEPQKSLEDTFARLKPLTEGLTTGIDSDMLLDGKNRIVWKYVGEDEYRACTVSKKDCIEIVDRFGTNVTRVDPTETGGELDGIWICFDNGYVYSPQLELIDGNAAYGRLFEYECELEPSAEFIKMIERIIQKAVD
ncbi:MAG: hypothetical protein J6L85_05370 [Clostridia bacterium]|nr:hypothetical protein [Clostridia bacterium]